MQQLMLIEIQLLYPQGLCKMVAEEYKERRSVVRLWVHECERVLCDRLVSDSDIAKFNDFRVSTARKHFDFTLQVSGCC